MTSQIDPTLPAQGLAFTSDMRANFSKAKSEIETLQGQIVSLQSQSKSISINGSHDITAGEAGNVYVSRLTGATTITLPPSPVLGNQVFIKDTDGSAINYVITVVGASGAKIDGNNNFRLDYAYAQARFSWSGTQWSVG